MCLVLTQNILVEAYMELSWKLMLQKSTSGGMHHLHTCLKHYLACKASRLFDNVCVPALQPA